MSYIQTFTSKAPARLLKLKTYKYADNWREAFRFRHVTGEAPAYNPPGAFYGSDHCRWIENVETAGLRFVGYVNEPRRWLYDGYTSQRDGFGYYADNFQNEVLKPVVYRLPGRKGAERFAYGYLDPCNEGAAFLAFDPCDNERDAARWADQLAERAAEDQREENAKFQAEQEQGDIADQLKAIRADIIALCREARQICPAIVNKPAVRNAIEARIRGALRDREKLRRRRNELAGNYWVAVQ